MMPKLVRAFETKDVAFFDRISTADFTEKYMGRTMTKKEAMAQMKTEMASVKAIKCSFKILSAKVMGNTGIAMTAGHMTMTSKPMGKEKSHKMVMDMWEKETWVRSGNGWKIKSLEEAKPMKMMVDGKPMDPSKMGGG